MENEQGTINDTIEEISHHLEWNINKSLFNSDEVEVVIAPLSKHIEHVQQWIVGNMNVGSQDLDFKSEAFKDPLSAEKLDEIGVNWVLIGD